jgi:predicted small lipoprotein YifL
MVIYKKFILVLMLFSASLFAAGEENGWFFEEEDKDPNKTQTQSEKVREDDSAELLSVKIDIEPADESNMVNLSQKGALEAAILGSGDFKIVDVDRTSVMLEGKVNNGVFRVEDVNNDGYIDLISTFDVDTLSLDDNSKELSLEGKTNEGIAFKGFDYVSVTQIPVNQTPAIEQ